MSDERILDYLSSRGRADVPPGFITSVMASLDDAPVGRSRFTVSLPALVAVGTLAVIALLALVLGPWRNIGPAPAPTDSTEAAPSEATVEELQAAVTDATERLASSPAVEGLQTYWIEEYLASATWFDWRRNGDQVVVTRSDIDVQAPWWTDPDGEPLSVGERIETGINVLVGDSWLRTGEAESWVVEDRTAAPRGPLTYGIGLLNGQIPAVPPVGEAGEATATRRDLDGGSRVWVIEADQEDAPLRAEWLIGPDGVLVSYTVEGPDPTFAPSGLVPTASIRSVIEFAPLEDPDPIPMPGDPPHPAEFGLPPDFPLGP